MDIIEKLEFDTIYHEHLRFYSLKPLSKLFSLAGMSLVDAEKIAEQLSDKHDPYLIVSAVKELESQGLFSSVHSYHKVGDKFKAGTGFQNALTYTDFSARFVAFISEDETKNLT